MRVPVPSWLRARAEAVTAQNLVTTGLCCGLEILQAVPTFGSDGEVLGMLAAEVRPDFREGLSLAARMYLRRREETVALLASGGHGRGGGMSGTRVTCRDLETGEEETAEIKDDYIIVTDGRCYLDGVQVYANGTVVLTIKRGEP